MQCANCHHQIEDPEALFCAQCGQSLCREGHCCYCGKQLHQKANFCDRCGAPVTVNPPLQNVSVPPYSKKLSGRSPPSRASFRKRSGTMLNRRRLNGALNGQSREKKPIKPSCSSADCAKATGSALRVASLLWGRRSTRKTVLKMNVNMRYMLAASRC
ncbi:MAG: hypothetical protein C0630_19240 [Sedimenticola selenatireducens]|uniref:DZANK-type domain-containing protein n=1 Tax=Sedimenticola selenatireducens TaxID=191960 RepID=A0A2N6CR91_9GAMM|nr:MAG: hypothetical protein C0630_19240 [Sedimenticola selenatireducens]